MATPSPRGDQNGSQDNHQNPIHQPAQGQEERPSRLPIPSQHQPSISHNELNHPQPNPYQLPPLPPLRGPPRAQRILRPPPYRVDRRQRLRYINNSMESLTRRWTAAHGPDGRGPGYTGIDQLQADYDEMKQVARIAEDRFKEIRDTLGQVTGVLILEPLPCQRPPMGLSPGQGPQPYSGAPQYPSLGRPPFTHGSSHESSHDIANMPPMDMSGISNTSIKSGGNGVNGFNSNHGQPPVDYFSVGNFSSNYGQPPTGLLPFRTANDNNGLNTASSSLHRTYEFQNESAEEDESLHDDDSK